MRRFKRILKRLLLTSAGLLAVFVLLAKLSQWTSPSTAQRETIAFMEQDNLPEGRDALALLWSLERDVSLDEVEMVLAADIEHAATWMDRYSPESVGSETPADEPDSGWRRDRYPDLTTFSYDEWFCSRSESDCLAKVREAPAETAAALARHEQLLQRTVHLRETDVLRYRFPGGVGDPILSLRGARMPLTAHALAFVQGDQAWAISETCLDLTTWRRLSTRTDSLIVAVNGTKLAGQGYARLLAGMLSEWPIDRPLPASCGTALAIPLNDELMLCNVMRGEFSRTKRGLAESLELSRRYTPWYDRLLMPLFFHDATTSAMFAEDMAPFCRAERPGRPDHIWQERGLAFLARWSCFGNLGGCMTVDLSSPSGNSAYSDYADRMVDFGARLRLVAALAWMREQAAASGERADVLIDRLPPEFTNTNPPIELAPDGQSLRVSLHDTRYGDWEEASLPEPLAR